MVTNGSSLTTIGLFFQDKKTAKTLVVTGMFTIQRTPLFRPRLSHKREMDYLTMMSPHRKILGSQENVPKTASRTFKTTEAPPKPPRSAFMCFADARKEEILKHRDAITDTDDILKIVAADWRNLDEAARAVWDEHARNDKVRYVREKAEYKGPWLAPKRRAKKHPLAPKRPMSAFLKYSQNRRAMVKEQNPDMSNTDVSRLLGEMWRNASELERRPYVEQEEFERAAYNETIKKWREKQAQIDVTSRTSHRAVKKETESRQPHHGQPHYHSGYDPFLQFEPLQIHTVDDAARKADEQIMMNPFPVHYYSTEAEHNRHQPMFRQHDSSTERYQQPLYRHQQTSFRSDRLASPPEYRDVEVLHRQHSASNHDNALHFSNSRGSYGPYAFPESSFYHYP